MRISKEGYYFSGQVADHIYETADAYLLGKKAQFRKKQPDEIDPNDDQKIAIELAQKHLTQELKTWGVSTPLPIETGTSHIHILPSSEFKKKSGIPNSAAFYNPHQDTIFVDKSAADNPERLYGIILHEEIHKASFKIYKPRIWKRSGTLDAVSNTKIGYKLTSPSEPNHTHLLGFNEAVTEQTAQEILRKNQAEVVGTFAQDLTALYGKYEAYFQNIDILAAIISQVANGTRTSEEDVWAKIRNGLFTGEVMHLRAIDEVLGRGSLRFIGDQNKGTVYLNELAELEEYNQFVAPTSTKEDRKKIAYALLNERERMKYHQLQRFTPSGLPWRANAA